MPDRRVLSRHKRGLKQRLRNIARYHITNRLRFAYDVLRLHLLRSKESMPKRRVALITDGFAGCSEEQITPLIEYRSLLRDRYRMIFREMNLGDVLRNRLGEICSFDVVCLKMTYRTDDLMAEAIVQDVRRNAPYAKLVYLDGDDDICIQWPNVIDAVDVYVKKHAFKDHSNYLVTYAGKSNLHDYVHKVYGHEFTDLDYGNTGDVPVVIKSSGPVRAKDLEKIVVGWNIALDRKLVKLRSLVGNQPISHDRTCDILFRGAVTKGTVTYYLRGGVADRLKQISKKYRILIKSDRVSQDEYYNELKSSKICVSPFGLGEICWRDFEAVLCGALLVKPNMDHIETTPDIFQPYETYVPVRWDFSDLQEVCERLLENEPERRRIAENAQRVLLGYYDSCEFAVTARSLFA
jgi:glycosyltransferase involved in cell wall biosynthesis